MSTCNKTQCHIQRHTSMGQRLTAKEGQAEHRIVYGQYGGGTRLCRKKREFDG